MPQKQMPASVFFHDADGVHFQAMAAGQMVNHQYFVERIFERVNRPVVRKKLPRERKMPGSEIRDPSTPTCKAISPGKLR